MREPNGHQDNDWGEGYREHPPEDLGSIKNAGKECIIAEDFIVDVTELLPPDPHFEEERTW